MKSNIFVVEDEHLVAQEIRATLESSGYTVAGTAPSRDLALEGIAHTLPDLVLMDIGLQGLGDGVETARLVRDRYRIPVVYLTGRADSATLHRAKSTQPFGYVLKPFHDEELIAAIQMAFYRQGVEERLEREHRWLATILGAISDGVIAADSLGVVRLINPAAQRIGGWKQSEALGRDIADVFLTSDVETGLPVDVPTLPAPLPAEGAPGIRHLRLLRRSDGSQTIIEQSIAAISEPSGVECGSVFVFRQLPRAGN